MKIAYLVNLYPAVSHTFIRREVLALERQGLQVLRYALHPGPVVDDRDRAERARTRYVLGRGPWPLAAALIRASVKKPRRLFAGVKAALSIARRSDRPWYLHLAYLGEACIVCEWAREDDVQHLHAHFATNPAEIALLVHLLGGPSYSFTGHGSDILDRPAQMGLPLTVGHAAFVVAVCAYGRSQICKWVPHRMWPKIRVVRCGLDADYAPVVSDVDVPGPGLVCVGRLSAEKGQLILVEALSLLQERGVRVPVTLVGDGPMRGEIEREITARGLKETVTLVGAQDTAGVQRAMAAARALVVPSLSEGLPVVIMEAMAMRRPVIAPYLAGIPELVKPSHTGWLYPAADAAALADRIEQCMAVTTADWRTMGAEARAAVTALHAIETEAAELAGLFRSTVNPF